MNINELLVNVSHEGSSETQVGSIEYDSRKAREDSLFVCLRGANVDGHKFALSAYNRGCRLFLCEEKVELPDDAEQFIVKDT